MCTLMNLILNHELLKKRRKYQMLSLCQKGTFNLLNLKQISESIKKGLEWTID